MAPYVFASAAALTTFAYGFNVGIIAVALLSIQRYWEVDALGVALVVSSMLAGAVFGSLVATHEAAGRKPMLLASCALLALGAFASASITASLPLLVAARFIVGLGVGMASILPGLLITEMSPAQCRGQLGVFNQISGFLGIVASYCVGLGVVGVRGLASGDISGLLFQISSMVAGFAFVTALLILPESPRWLLQRGQNAAALAVIKDIYGPENEAEAAREFNAVCESQSAASKDALSSPKLPWRLWWLVLGLQVVQQAAGSGFLTYYAASIFRSWGLSAEAAIGATLLSSLPQLAVFAASLKWNLIETLGRRRLLLLSSAAICVVLAALGAISLFGSELAAFNATLFSVLLVAGLTAHRIAYALGLAPVPSILIAESVPFLYRSRVLSIALTLNWALNFVLTLVIPVLAGEDLSSGLGWVYCGLAVAGMVGLLFIARFVKETRGLALEAAEEMHMIPVLPADQMMREHVKILPVDSALKLDSKPMRPPPIPQLHHIQLEV